MRQITIHRRYHSVKFTALHSNLNGMKHSYFLYRNMNCNITENKQETVAINVAVNRALSNAHV